jgi:pimeloyl-ACP methyl ester carboxylesterase
MLEQATSAQPDNFRECLVVVIPGIGGSTLRRPDGKVAWDGSYHSMARFLANPKRLRDLDDGLEPAGVIRTPTRFLGRAPFYGYQVLIDRLAKEFATVPDYGDRTGDVHPEARVVSFPYDFRRDCEHNAAKLEEFVYRRLRHFGLGDKRSVIVVAHSMGGIVARTWVDRFDRWATCRYLVTLGTPHHGAPKTLEMLVNGSPGWKVGRIPGIRSTLRAWPSTYDLLPMYQAIECDGEHLTPSDFFKNQLTASVEQNEMGKAFDRYERTTEQWTAQAWSLGNAYFIGTGRATCQFAQWNGMRLRTYKSVCPWLQEPSSSKIGDGTVPQISAIPMEHQADGWWHEVREKHNRMPDAELMAERVIKELCLLAGKSEYGIFDWWLDKGRRTRGDESDLQIDIEDAYFIDGDPPPVALEWSDHGDFPDDKPYYRITLLSDPGQPAVEGWFTSRKEEELRWEFTLPPLSRGMYRIETSPSPYWEDHQQSAEALFDVFNDATIEKESDHA